MGPQDVGICLNWCLKHKRMTLGLVTRGAPLPLKSQAETISWQGWKEHLGIHRSFSTFNSKNLVQAFASLLLALFSFTLFFSSSVFSRKSLSKLTSDSDHMIAYFPLKPVATGVCKAEETRDCDPP